eukprot:COSAG05_NODE_17861_length_318_cov_0.703196_1_plen_40_part_01
MQRAAASTRGTWSTATLDGAVTRILGLACVIACHAVVALS